VAVELPVRANVEVVLHRKLELSAPPRSSNATRLSQPKLSLGPYGSAERSGSPKTPHPRATNAQSRGIKFPISLLARKSWTTEPLLP